MTKEILVFPHWDFKTHCEVLKNSSFAELRLDIHRYTHKEYEELLALPIQWIVSFRGEEHVEHLDFFLSQRPSYIDLDFSLISPFFVEKINNAVSTCIVSYHGFYQTPSEGRLYELWKQCKRTGAQIIKLVFEAKALKDNKKLLFLYGFDTQLIAFNMGELGKESRVYAALQGEQMIYLAPDGFMPLATGQLTMSEWKQIKEKLCLK